MKRIVTFAAVAAVAMVIAPDLAMAKNAKNCPPGLAKKSPACVPPGLAKKGVESDDRVYRDDDDRHHDDDRWRDRWSEDDYRRLREGDVIVLNSREYVVVDTSNGTILRRNNDFYRLPVFGDGSEIVRVGDAILRVDRKTKAAIELIELADLILN